MVLYAEPHISSVAYHVVEQISDYPTLVRLSMTCSLFHDLITGRQKLKSELFNKLETSEHHICRTADLSGCRRKLDCWINSLQQSYRDHQPNWRFSKVAKHGNLPDG